ncbi:MAG: hypothetical protein SVR94_11080 [Pseudomonadota bacterium]|nr:hypothetical protein [Pseudomonadota bacterium]
MIKILIWTAIITFIILVWAIVIALIVLPPIKPPEQDMQSEKKEKTVLVLSKYKIFNI